MCGNIKEEPKSMAGFLARMLGVDTNDAYNPHMYSMSNSASDEPMQSTEQPSMHTNVAQAPVPQTPMPNPPVDMRRKADNQARSYKDMLSTEQPQDAAQVSMAPPNSEQQPVYVAQQDTQRTIMCPPEHEQYNYGLSSWLPQHSQPLIDRRNLNMTVVPGSHISGEPREIMVMEAGPPHNGKYGPGMAPRFNSYGPDLYRSEVLDSDRRVSTGVMMNAYTGRMYETFEDDLPPPDTDRSISKERLSMTNPQLMRLNGWDDPHNPIPREGGVKRELCQEMPRADDGPNVWGDQLYADRRRADLDMRAARELYMNRTGIYSTEPVDDRKSVGYVGYVPAYRGLPYLPPTQRTSIDNKGWAPAAGRVGTDFGASHDVIMPRIEVRKPDMSECSRAAYAQTMSGIYASDTRTMPDVRNTNRDMSSIEYTGPTGDLNTNGYAMPGKQSLVRASLVPEEADERHWANARLENGDVFPVDPSSLLPTQRGTYNSDGTIVTAAADTTGAYTSRQTGLETWTMRGCGDDVPTAALAPHNGAPGIVVQDTKVRDTLKAAMEAGFPTRAINTHNGAPGVVVVDTKVRDTLKAAMEAGFPTRAINTHNGTPGIVVTDYTRRPKAGVDLTEQAFAAANAQNGDALARGPDFQGKVLPTRRQFYEDIPREGFSGGTSEHWGDQVHGTSDALPTSRDTQDLNWFPVSRVPAEAGGTSTRWVPYADVETQREFQQRAMPAQKAELNEPRVLPEYQVRCKRDDTDNLYTQNGRRYFTPDYYRET